MVMVDCNSLMMVEDGWFRIDWRVHLDYNHCSILLMHTDILAKICNAEVRQWLNFASVLLFTRSNAVDTLLSRIQRQRYGTLDASWIFSKKRNVSYGILDMCACGMQDQSGYYTYKPTCLLHNFGNGVLDPVFKRCTNKLGGAQHIHQPSEVSADLSLSFLFCFNQSVPSTRQGSWTYGSLRMLGCQNI